MSYIYNRMSVYLAAHQDDWQLFMEPLLSKDLNDTACKTVIIHTTAGDAGMDDDYWRARETAAIQSLIFCLSEDGPVTQSSTIILVENRQLCCHKLNHIVIYFLRLPDGNVDGSGFSKQHYSSLQKLHQASITALRTVDHSAVYESFSELADQIQAVINFEASNSEGIVASLILLNFPEYDSAISPQDHSDHYVTGYLGAALTLAGKSTKRLFTHYATLQYDSYLQGDALFRKTGMFAVYHQVVLQESGYSTLGEKSHYQRWCTRDAIYREI